MLLTLGYTARPKEGYIDNLMDYKARFYDVSLGRFLQPDTIIPGAGNPQNLNRFSYVGNSPIVFNDPSGHMQACGINGENDCPDHDPTPLPSGEGNGGGGASVSGHHRRHGGDANDEPTSFGDDAAEMALYYLDSPNVYDPDCTNFISTALLSAGLKPDDLWHRDNNDLSTGAAWYTSWMLYSHLTDKKTNGGLGFESAVISNNYGSKIQNNQNLNNFMKTGNLEKGDLVFFTADEYTKPSHVAIIIGFDKATHMPLIVEHSGPTGFTLPRPLTSSSNTTITSISFVFLPRQAP